MDESRVAAKPAQEISLPPQGHARIPKHRILTFQSLHVARTKGHVLTVACASYAAVISWVAVNAGEPETTYPIAHGVEKMSVGRMLSHKYSGGISLFLNRALLPPKKKTSVAVKCRIFSERRIFANFCVGVIGWVFL